MNSDDEINDDACEVYEPFTTKEQGKCAGALTQLKEKNWEKINAEKEINRLMALILKCGDEKTIRGAMQGKTIKINYRAIKGKYTTKSGKITDAYISIYGKYAGSITKNSDAPLLNYYVSYEAKNFDFINGKLVYKWDCFTYNNITVDVEED